MNTYSRFLGETSKHVKRELDVAGAYRNAPVNALEMEGVGIACSVIAAIGMAQPRVGILLRISNPL